MQRGDAVVQSFDSGFIYVNSDYIETLAGYDNRYTKAQLSQSDN